MELKRGLLIGQMLIDAGLITSEQLDTALKEQKKSGGLICSVMVRLGFIKEEQYIPILSRQLNIPYVSLRDLKVSSEVLSKVNAKFVSHYKLMPVELKDNTLIIAV